MMSYNNVFEIVTDTHGKSFVKLVCCNVGKEIKLLFKHFFVHYHI